MALQTNLKFSSLPAHNVTGSRGSCTVGGINQDMGMRIVLAAH